LEQVGHEDVRVRVPVHVTHSQVHPVGAAQPLAGVGEDPRAVVAPHLVRLSVVRSHHVQIAISIHVRQADTTCVARAQALSRVGQDASGVAPHLVAGAVHSQEGIRIAVTVHICQSGRQHLARANELSRIGKQACAVVSPEPARVQLIALEQVQVALRVGVCERQRRGGGSTKRLARVEEDPGGVAPYAVGRLEIARDQIEVPVAVQVA
jgi:hypothetical protein